jgi:hypothetical protein
MDLANLTEKEIAALKVAAFRDQVFDLQQALTAAVADNVLQRDSSELFNHYAKGVYARTLAMPAGSLIVGKIHKFSHLNIIHKGRIRVQTEDGYCIYDATEFPVFFVSKAGTKRVVFPETDTIWTTIHPTGCDEVIDDLEYLERKLYAGSYDEMPKLESVGG